MQTICMLCSTITDGELYKIAEDIGLTVFLE